MKVFKYIPGFLLFITLISYPQNDYGVYRFHLSNNISNKKVLLIKENDNVLMHAYYGIGINEVLFSKMFDRSFISSTGHDIGAGFALNYTGRKISAEIKFALFYLYSKQRSLHENRLQTEYHGFGIKAPQVSLGYNFGNTVLGFYYPFPFDFSWFKFTNNNYPPSFTEEEKSYLDAYNNKYKYSSSREFGAFVKPFKNVNINFGYECRLFNPGYKILQQYSGTVIELSIFSICYTMLYAFMYGGVELNPFAGAFLFLLPEAYSFTVTELKKKSINWPFKSEAPLYYNTFKMSLSVMF